MAHIPQGTTASLELELFDPALEAALRRSEEYDVSRWLYVPNTYSEYRYILGTRGKHPLICVGINPSTAAPDLEIFIVVFRIPNDAKLVVIIDDIVDGSL